MAQVSKAPSQRYRLCSVPHSSPDLAKPILRVEAIEGTKALVTWQHAPKDSFEIKFSIQYGEKRKEIPMSLKNYAVLEDLNPGQTYDVNMTAHVEHDTRRFENTSDTEQVTILPKGLVFQAFLNEGIIQSKRRPIGEKACFCSLNQQLNNFKPRFTDALKAQVSCKKIEREGMELAWDVVMPANPRYCRFSVSVCPESGTVRCLERFAIYNQERGVTMDFFPFENQTIKVTTTCFHYHDVVVRKVSDPVTVYGAFSELCSHGTGG